MSECSLSAESSSSHFLSDGINALVTLATIGFGVVLLVAGRVSLGATAAFFAAIDGFQENY